MKIAIILERIESWRGGAETSTQQFARALRRAGHDVHLITRCPKTPVENFNIHPVDPYTAINQQRTITFARHAAAYTARQSFDIIHAVTPCMTADIYQPRGGFVVESVARNLAIHRSLLARLGKRIANNFNKKQQGMIRLERRLLTRSPAPPYIAAVSQYVARQAKQHFDLPDDRARVIFNGSEFDKAPPDRRATNARDIRARYRIAEDELLALFIAHNFKLKGLRFLIHAVKQLADRNIPIRTLVIGHDNAIPYRRLAGNIGVPDRIGFIGPTTRVPDFLHAADFLVHPTFYDPCSRVVLEAIAAGLPTITTRFNGAAEIITDNVTGHIIDEPTNIAALAAAMARLADPDHRKTISENALALRDRFDIANHTRQMIQLYEEVYREKARGRSS